MPGRCAGGSRPVGRGAWDGVRAVRSLVSGPRVQGEEDLAPKGGEENAVRGAQRSGRSASGSASGMRSVVAHASSTTRLPLQICVRPPRVALWRHTQGRATLLPQRRSVCRHHVPLAHPLRNCGTPGRAALPLSPSLHRAPPLHAKITRLHTQPKTGPATARARPSLHYLSFETLPCEYLTVRRPRTTYPQQTRTPCPYSPTT